MSEIINFRQIYRITLATEPNLTAKGFVANLYQVLSKMKLDVQRKDKEGNWRKVGPKEVVARVKLTLINDILQGSEETRRFLHATSQNEPVSLIRELLIQCMNWQNKTYKIKGIIS